MTRLALEVRVQREVNTDPQRRCYNGCHAKSELVWSEWEFLYFVANKQEGEASITTYTRINPGREYRLKEYSL